LSLHKVKWPVSIVIPLLTMLIATPIPAFGRANINHWINVLFSKPCYWLRDNIFPYSPKFEGFFTDSLNYIILLFFAAIIGLIVAILIHLSKINHAFFVSAIYTSSIYYLAWIFLIYGFSKLLGAQFPVTDDAVKLSQVSGENKDFLFWQFMGFNQALVVILGLIEVTISATLLFKKTRSFGLFSLTTSLIVIFGINLYFDISVKVFSGLLLLVAIALLLLRHMSLPLNNLDLDSDSMFTKDAVRKPIKLFTVGFIFISALFTSL
jgi:hypothetical protein